MSNTECPSTRRAELFVRSDLPEISEHRRTEIESRLQELLCGDVLDEMSTTVWNKRVPVEGCDSRPERSLYNEFAEWAADAGVCLAPFFDTRICYSWETGQKRKELVLPALCLAIYEDGELARLAPFARGGTPHSIDDSLDELESETTPPLATTATASTAD